MPTNNTQGQSALVHLHVPAAMKARWVRQSRADGLKLSDWIIKQVERSVNVYKVHESLESKYHGSGYALAATLNGQLIDIVYLDDVLPDFDGTRDAMLAAMSDDRLVPTVRKLQALGQVHAGMLSAWEFVEL